MRRNEILASLENYRPPLSVFMVQWDVDYID